MIGMLRKIGAVNWLKQTTFFDHLFIEFLVIPVTYRWLPVMGATFGYRYFTDITCNYHRFTGITRNSIGSLPVITGNGFDNYHGDIGYQMPTLFMKCQTNPDCKITVYPIIFYLKSELWEHTREVGTFPIPK